MKKSPTWSLFVLFFTLLSLLPAAPASERESVAALKEEMTAMREQMRRLRIEMEVMEARVQALTHERGQKDEAPARRAEVEAAPAAAPRPKVDSRYGVRLYGKVKMDAIWDSNNLGSSELIKYIPQTADGRSQTSFTARETRFGLALGGPEWSDWQVTGKLETDFYGSATSGGSGSLRLRLAYADITNGRTGVRIGQDWVPIAGMNPATTNFTIMGYNGNLWNRTPQITVRQSLGGNWSGLLTAFRSREDEDFQGALDCDLEMPWVGAKVGYEARLLDQEAPAFFGVSAAVRNGRVERRSVTPFLYAFEFKVPLGPLGLSGEMYHGEGLGGEFLHAGGAYNLAGDPIATSGGFAQLGMQVIDRMKVHVGYGLDNPRDGDLLGDEFFRESTYLFGNAAWAFSPDLSVILEGTRVETTWSDGARDGLRLQSSMIYLW